MFYYVILRMGPGPVKRAGERRASLYGVGAGSAEASPQAPAPDARNGVAAPGAEDPPPAVLACVPPARPGEAPASEARD